MTFYFMMKWIPKIVVDIGYPASQAGGVLVWANAGGAAGSFALSLMTQRVRVRILTVLVLLGSFITVSAFGQDLETLAALSLAAFIAGFFTNGTTAGIYALLAQSFPVYLRASGTGLVIGIGRAGAALGPIFAGLLFASGLPLSSVAPILSCGSLTAGLLLLVMGRRLENPGLAR
jgi:cyanate permease